MKYYVIYTDRCTPCMCSFNDKLTMDEWLVDFLIENTGSPDHWVDYVFRGELIKASNGITIKENE